MPAIPPGSRHKTCRTSVKHIWKPRSVKNCMFGGDRLDLRVFLVVVEYIIVLQNQHTICMEEAMASPLSIRIDERLRLNLEQEAAASGIPLSQLVRDLLETGAKRARRDRIRRDSARVARYVAATPSAQELFEETGGTHGA